ncbi:MAG: hypothetical protein H6732_01430 [Alphaproteobacteria bacterium]|nr:hypothetical protein [Alphaproteobacteria bacterium]
MRGLVDIVRELLGMLPPWAALLVVAAVLTVAAPGLRTAMRSRQIRESVRQMVRADPSRKAILADRALGRAGGSPALLSLVATEAHRRQLPSLHARALDALAAVPHGRVELARLRRTLAPERAAPRHPLETVVRVEQLLEAGAVAAARARLDEGLAEHPSDPAIQDVAAKVRAAEAALDAPEGER